MYSTILLLLGLHCVQCFGFCFFVHKPLYTGASVSVGLHPRSQTAESKHMSILNFNRCYPIACFPRGTVVKNLPANTGDTKDAGSIPGYGRCPRAGNGNPLPYSCLENSMDRGAWWATVHRVAESRTRLSDYHADTSGCFPQRLEHSTVLPTVSKMTLFSV